MKRLIIASAVLLLAATPQAQRSSSPAPKIDPQRILERIKVISADEFEGRAPGSKGEELTVKYLEDEFKKLGLKPGNPDGTYRQKVPLVGITGSEVSPLTVTKDGQQQTYKFRDEVVAFSEHVAANASIQNSEMVFAGYGVQAPEFNWDDFKGLDVKGKTLIVLVNDPAVADPKNASRLDPSVFRGEAMTYYGRWSYKYEKAAELGAAGVFVVHEEGPAGYPYSVVQGFLGERFGLVSADKNLGRASIQGWLSLDATKKLLAAAGQDFDALKKLARTREFKPVPLGLTASMRIANKLRTVESQNVIAKLEGGDPALRDEYVIYTSHWDHLGVGTPNAQGDRIYNGALDNASGVSALIEVARAFTQVKPQPKRTILFLMVTAEEQGLLGSKHYAENPLYPLDKTLANVNMDGVNQWGRTTDVVVVGMGASDLDDYLRAAAKEQGRVLRPDPEPEKGFYYRSDHFNFAKQGVPALYTDAGDEFIGKPAGYGTKKREEFTAKDYHAPSDEVKPDWDLSGAAEDAQLMFMVGYRVANAAKFPEWKPGNEFKAKRDKMMKSR
jgi:Zn-dependent M28 family amino/carboxypeptidase